MSLKALVITLGGTLIAIIGIAILFSSSQKSDSATMVYAISDKDRPKVESPETSFDFGEMKVTEEKQKDFALKNSGTKPLQIFGAQTSCDCTFGQIFYKDFKSEEFGMHHSSGFVTEIAPGDVATVRVTYRPLIMPVYGSVERELYLSTNDPQYSKITYSIKATVK